MNSVNYVTRETYEKMKEELTQLKTSGRSEIAEAIAEAREKGDLKENAEYDAAKEAQRLHESKIARLEMALIEARILDKTNIDTSKVSILSIVTIKNKKVNKLFTYQIVSETEANLKENKISAKSPIAAGLIGKSVGEIASVQTPSGIIDFEILKIEA